MKTKEQKRIEAEARATVYRNLEPLVKLGRLDNRPGESRRERARLKAVAS